MSVSEGLAYDWEVVVFQTVPKGALEANFILAVNVKL